MSCCVLPETAEDAAWLHLALRAPGLKRVSFRGSVFSHDTVEAHSAFVRRLGSCGLATSVEWLDVRGLRPDDDALVSLVASLAHHKKIAVAVGLVSKTVGMRLLERAGSNVALGLGGDDDMAMVRGRRADFAAVAELVKQGKEKSIAGIREVDDKADKTLVASVSSAERRKKPWEK